MDEALKYRTDHLPTGEMVSIHSITIDVHMFQVVTSNPELESPLTRILRLDSMSILSKGNSVQPPVLGSLKNMRLGPPPVQDLSELVPHRTRHEMGRCLFRANSPSHVGRLQHAAGPTRKDLRASGVHALRLVQESTCQGEKVPIRGCFQVLSNEPPRHWKPMAHPKQTGMHLQN